MKSKRLVRLAAAGVAVALLFGCGGSDSDNAVSGSPPAPVAPGSGSGPQTVTDKGIVSGKIVDEGGAAVPSVKVTLDGTSVTSNEQGFFVFEGAAPGANKALRFEKSGFVEGNNPVTVTVRQLSFVNATMKKVGVTRTGVSGTSPATVTDGRSDGRNGSVGIPANAVVDSSGRVAATYTVELTTMVPSDPAFSQTFPGRFAGGAQPGSTANPALLRSFGVVNVDLKDAQGAKLRLASGASATISFPIPPAPHDPQTPTVPLWSLDQASGIWIQEGVATRTGSQYVGQVTHFSPWNCDQLVPGQSFKEVRVRGLNGVPVSNATVIVDGTGYRQTAVTGSDGIIAVPVSGGDTIRVSAEKGSLKSAVITEIAAPAGQTKVNIIDLVEPLVTVMLSWGSTPSDLDSHLLGPGALHVYFSSPGQLALAPFARLDTDDTNSFGPEITTLSGLSAGSYRYAVHNYGTPTTAIQSSAAIVNLVVSRTGLIRRYEVPATDPTTGNLWTVFELVVDGAGNPTVRDVNTITLVGLQGQGIQ